MMPFMHRSPPPTVMVFLFAFLFFPSISTGQTQDAVGYFDQGMKAFNAADYRGAHPIFQKAVQENPANLEAQYLLAVTK
ncbi:MAG: tetratricopeptide repeat protein, partial [Deltaproteobacteria bacterium]|nr:tetratricopeptide repeat protein [Deltaproteobacteria bacterium]